MTAIRATFRKGETATDGPVAGRAGTSGSSGRRGPSGPPRPFWLPVWDLAAQGTLPGRGSLHNYGFIYTTSLPNAQEGGPPFSKGAATPVRSFRVMGMRRVSVPKSINQSEIRPKFVLRPPVGKWNEHACMLLSRDCARRTVRSPNQLRLARSHSMPDALSIV